MTEVSVPVLLPQAVAPVLQPREQPGDRGMVDRLVAVVGDQVLLADIGDVARFAVLGEQVVEGLVLLRADLFGDRLVPFVAVREDGIDVEDHPAEIEHAVADDVADREIGMRDRRRGDLGNRGVGDVVAGHGCNLMVLLCHTSRTRQDALVPAGSVR
jgi:hypothetical protein